MLFNSYVFILLFLPLSLIVFFIFNHLKLTAVAKIWLTVSSLFFYGWWNFNYLPLILTSILFNYFVGSALTSSFSARSMMSRQIILLFGITFNLALLGYYKYSNFLISNINSLFDLHMKQLSMTLPLGISFFTFTQIAFLVDVFRKKAGEYNVVNYSLFVTFFPHLLAGPIIHHKEMMPQFDRLRNKIVDYRNLSAGFFLFSIGLFKKVMLADNLALWANRGYDFSPVLTLVEAWTTSLSYSLQLYFDFSGYTDMALGTALMFNIKLPINFNSPYRSLNIQEFWRRWHITLSRFLKEYVYIPLGGNRISGGRTLSNLMVTFLLGGLWHGAEWTFVLWGFLHGMAIIIHRLWGKVHITVPKVVAWFVTFNFVNIAWVFFRAKNFDSALKVLKGMLGVNGLGLPQRPIDLVLMKDMSFYPLPWLNNLQGNGKLILLMLAILPVVLLRRNSNEIAMNFRPTVKYGIYSCLMIVTSLIVMMTATANFIYFNF